MQPAKRVILSSSSVVQWKEGGKRGEGVGLVVCVDLQQRRGDAAPPASTEQNPFPLLLFKSLSSGLDFILLFSPFDHDSVGDNTSITPIGDARYLTSK